MEYANGREQVQAMLTELLAPGPLDLARVERHVARSYQQRVDGRTLDFDGFVAHLQHLKSVIADLEITTLASAEQGRTVFSHHLVSATRRDGARLRMQVLAQFTLEAGKVVGCDELTHLLEGAPEDRDLGARQ